jgi:hypothetical protein
VMTATERPESERNSFTPSFAAVSPKRLKGPWIRAYCAPW